MCKATCHSDVVDSSNPRRWRGEWLHHHGGGVCWLFVLLWMDSWRHELILCKKWYKNNLKMRLTALLFDPPRRAPHRYLSTEQELVKRKKPSQWNNQFSIYIPVYSTCLPTYLHACKPIMYDSVLYWSLNYLLWRSNLLTYLLTYVHTYKPTYVLFPLCTFVPIGAYHQHTKVTKLSSLCTYLHTCETSYLRTYVIYVYLHT